MGERTVFSNIQKRNSIPTVVDQAVTFFPCIAYGTVGHSLYLKSCGAELLLNFRHREPPVPNAKRRLAAQHGRLVFGGCQMF